MLPIPGIYMINNIVTRRVYVGSSQNVARRCSEHRHQLTHGQHPVHTLQVDWLTHGPSAFTFTLLEPTTFDNIALSRHERKWQRRLKEIGLSLYGVIEGGRATTDRRSPGLRRLRTLAALSQGELAERVGVQRQTINRLENGGKAEMPTIRKIAEALSCTPADLMKPAD